MKISSLSLVAVMVSLSSTAGTISKTYSFSASQVEISTVSTDTGARSKVTYNGLDNCSGLSTPGIPVKSVLFKVPDNAVNIANDYTPMVVEGKTWWQSTERWPDRWKRENYYHYEVGFTIGSEVEIDGVKWHKLYISHYRDGVNYIDGIKWNEDESLLGYIREENRRVLTYMGNIEEKGDRYKSLFGDTYAILLPAYPRSDTSELLIYDFNKRDFLIGSLDYDPNSIYTYWEPLHLKYLTEEVVNNSGRDYRKFTYTHEGGNAANGEETYFIEGIGITKSIDCYRECLFFLPMIDMEFTALSGLKLRYVTDKDYNILFEQEGGVKLWDEMAGVGNVAVESRCDSMPVWYNMQGVIVTEPSTPGIYIRRVGDKSEKVVVK